MVYLLKMRVILQSLDQLIRQTINPGPAVTATIADTLSIFILLSFKAFFVIKLIFSTCDLAANSGTTPPNSL